MKKYAIGLYEKAMHPGLSWREKLAFAKESGYDFVEISIDSPSFSGSGEDHALFFSKKASTSFFSSAGLLPLSR